MSLVETLVLHLIPFSVFVPWLHVNLKFEKMLRLVIGLSAQMQPLKKKPKHLIFAMKVEEKIAFNEYWTDPRFINKKPILSGSRKYQYGDNIYHKENNEWYQLPSHHSQEDGSPNQLNIKTDTQYDGVLISSFFYYFGRNSIALPHNLQSIIKVGRGHKYIDTKLHTQLFDFLNSNTPGINGTPSDWEVLSLQSKQLSLIF